MFGSPYNMLAQGPQGLPNITDITQLLLLAGTVSLMLLLSLGRFLISQGQSSAKTDAQMQNFLIQQVGVNSDELRKRLAQIETLVQENAKLQIMLEITQYRLTELEDKLRDKHLRIESLESRISELTMERDALIVALQTKDAEITLLKSANGSEA